MKVDVGCSKATNKRNSDSYRVVPIIVTKNINFLKAKQKRFYSFLSLVKIRS
jgi:hypothetical protein